MNSIMEDSSTTTLESLSLDELVRGNILTITVTGRDCGKKEGGTTKIVVVQADTHPTINLKATAHGKVVGKDTCLYGSRLHGELRDGIIVAGSRIVVRSNGRFVDLPGLVVSWDIATPVPGKRLR
jgi:hypothetical protein